VLEEGGNYVGDVEGKFLADLKGKTVEITMQFKREDNPTIPKFYIWKLRFL
jgi:hypothetical protein